MLDEMKVRGLIETFRAEAERCSWAADYDTGWEVQYAEDGFGMAVGELAETLAMELAQADGTEESLEDVIWGALDTAFNLSYVFHQEERKALDRAMVALAQGKQEGIKWAERKLEEFRTR